MVKYNLKFFCRQLLDLCAVLPKFVLASKYAMFWAYKRFKLLSYNKLGLARLGFNR